MLYLKTLKSASFKPVVI